ncbi:hypothetical protein ABW20_dc0101120 [Dactylellina cionopaga]|nr:hypothetical protein ABW20_dc0101120 [Dactylellina cionopaga]
MSHLSLNDSTNSLPTSEEAVTLKRREWYPVAWKKLLDKNNYDGVITTVHRYLEITEKANVDLDCYFALVAASAAKKGTDTSVLDKIDMSHLSDTDLVDIHLLRSLVFLKHNEVEKAQDEGKIASEKAFPLKLQDSCHYIMGLIACYTEDYIEGAFRRSLLPEGFQLPPRFIDLIRRLPFKDAKWMGQTRYTTKDITKELPIPPNFAV